MSETRKLAAILVADVVGYSRLAGTDEDRTLARLRGLRSDLIDPAIAAHHGRIVKRTGDGSIIEFRSVVDAVRCAIEVQNGLIERNAGVPEDRRIQFRVGIHVGDVVEEVDGDLMGNGVNIAARLESVAKPGAVCLSEQAYWQVKGRLDLKVSDLGLTQLKNIAEPIHVYSLEVGAPAQAKHTPAPPPEKSAPPRLSIAVLPFANMSGDPEQDYFADGITDDLTTDLSHLADSFVISRGTAFTYKGKPIDAKQIGRELGVRYLLEGSVRRSDEKIAVNAQLISTETGAHVWADRFDGERSKLGELQVDFVSRLANSLGWELIKAEALRAMRERPSNPDAVDLAMQGRVKLYSDFSKAGRNSAIALFDRAVALDAQNVPALTGLADALVDRVGNLWSDDPAGDIARAEKALDAASALEPHSSSGHVARGWLFFDKRQWAAMMTEVEAAIADDPNNAWAHVLSGVSKTFLGHSEDTFADFETALRLSPRDPGVPWWQFHICHSHSHLAQWEEAIKWCDKAAVGLSQTIHPFIVLAAANAWLGRMQEAKAAAAQLEKIQPGFTIQSLVDMHLSDDPAFNEQLQRIFEGLRKAGVPEGEKKTN
jgi:class 3 adenylate cyclase/TolB-like protein